MTHVAVTTEPVVTEDGARKLPPRFLLLGRTRRPLLRLLLLAIVAGLAYVGYRFGPDILAAQRAGFFEKNVPKEYVGTSMDNLRALRTALLLYHTSEERFPDASGWMDAIEPLLNTADLKAGEAAKKLHRPGLAETEFGYGMNDACDGKYKDDVAGKDSAILVFESKSTSRNTHGDPAKDSLPGGQHVTIGEK